MPSHRRPRRRIRDRRVPFDAPTVDHVADSVRHLESLRSAISDTDPTLFARPVHRSGRPPSLHVNNPEAERFAEDIGVRPESAGEPGRFVWSWGEVITPVTTPEIAAERIRTVLAARNDMPTRRTRPTP
ncbi:hypothetical protein [Thermomonospora umbrina]|uniref:Uncharacterized protein n=1 Tax=Thermomonospora umbrina TaxID=111806 RepID=A0A3D9T0N9_9ACTN|nr:hypothetical protein [Thermomonospora umbrina]REE98364.1 hypothetical protein DFJ69_3851 [Thermomonospora umbrina]